MNDTAGQKEVYSDGTSKRTTHRREHCVVVRRQQQSPHAAEGVQNQESALLQPEQYPPEQPRQYPLLAVREQTADRPDLVDAQLLHHHQHPDADRLSSLRRFRPAPNSGQKSPLDSPLTETFILSVEQVAF